MKSTLFKSHSIHRWSQVFSLATQLRFGLLLLMLLSLLPTGGILIYLGFQAQLKQTQLLQQERSQAVASQIENYLADLQRKIGYLARVRGLSDLDAQIQQQFLEGLTRHNDAYEAIAILNSKGEVISNISVYETVKFENMANSPAFLRAFKQQEDYIGSVEIDATSRLPVTLMAVPIRNQADQVDGVLVAQINLSFLSFVVSQTQVGETGYTYIVDDRNTLIAEKGATSSDFRLQNLSNQPLLSQIFSVEETGRIRSYQGLKGVEVLGATTQIPSVDWYLVVELPTREAYALTRQMLIIMAGAIVLLTIILVGVGFLLSQAVVSPLARLTNAATQISAGDLDVRVNLQSRNELGILARAFNRMAQQLQESFMTLEMTNLRLEQRVEARTTELKAAKQATDRANDELRDLNNWLEQRVEARTAELTTALQQLKQSQLHLVQSEKMSALGQLVAGVAHEINNPVNFIHGNLVHVRDYTHDILKLIQLFCQHYPNPPAVIQAEMEAADLDFLTEDLAKVLQSMQMGTERIRELVFSLRNFSRLDEAEVKNVDVHEGIDNTLTILEHRLKAKNNRPEIQIVKCYSQLPKIECYAGQLNQVFMNILSNAVDALEECNEIYNIDDNKQQPSMIRIWTKQLNANQIAIHIADNGMGMSEQIRSRIFDPFFTTKSVGKGTGLGLSISYQIITERHKGNLYCHSTLGQGTEFVIEIPICQSAIKAA